tara:strand:- start:114 stop:653 length:540 start_codon:yes stop_codon:yes gene_type:complete
MKKLFLFLLLCSLGFSQQIVQTETHEDGYIEVINYYKKKRSSSGTYKLIKVKSERYHDSGNLYELMYFNEDGEENGLYKSYFENGQLEEEKTYKNGKEEGPYKSYFENGQLEWEYYYTLGDIDDTKLVKRWYENGQLYQVGFVDESGYYWKTRKTYSEEGKLLKEETFKDGDVIESKEY